MEITQQFQLIEGVFTADEAKKMLLSVINSKINYHTLESFSSEITSSGDKISHSKKRVESLERWAKSIIELSRHAEQSNSKFKISGIVTIELLE